MASEINRLQACREQGCKTILCKEPKLWYHLQMEKRLSGDKLHGFFSNVIRQSFGQLGINDATVAEYVAEVLTRAVPPTAWKQIREDELPVFRDTVPNEREDRAS